MAKGPFAPTGVQLSAAIAAELENSKKILSVEDLRSKILEHHADWKIPDRRVKKFLKRHLNKHGDPSGADDDSTVASVPSKSPSKSPGNRLRTLFGFNKNNKNKHKSMMISNDAPESAPESLFPPLTSESSPKNEQEILEVPNIEELEPVLLKQIMHVDQVYNDDNDGSKNNDCFPCQACTLM